MDANRMQLAAALQSRGNPQGGQMAQEGYAQRPGIPTRQGMPQPGFGGGGMQPAPGAGGFPMFGGQRGFNGPPPEVQQALSAMRGAPGSQPMGGKPSMGAGGRPMAQPRY